MNEKGISEENRIPEETLHKLHNIISDFAIKLIADYISTERDDILHELEVAVDEIEEENDEIEFDEIVDEIYNENPVYDDIAEITDQIAPEELLGVNVLCELIERIRQ
ncbi:MAG: hypothetical protein K2H59_01695 [Muribaculaceae bacterium]|nr:hypothetical protein [Muribaculaceae bacterium]